MLEKKTKNKSYFGSLDIIPARTQCSLRSGHTAMLLKKSSKAGNSKGQKIRLVLKKLQVRKIYLEEKTKTNRKVITENCDLPFCHDRVH